MNTDTNLYPVSLLQDNNKLDINNIQELQKELQKQNSNTKFRYKNQYNDLLSKMNYNNLTQEAVLKNAIYAKVYTETLAKLFKFDKVYLINFEFYCKVNKYKKISKWNDFINKLQCTINHIIQVNDIKTAYQLLEQYYDEKEVSLLRNFRRINKVEKLTKREQNQLKSIMVNLRKKRFMFFNLNKQCQLANILPCYIQVYDCFENTYNYYTLIEQSEFLKNANVIKQNRSNVFITQLARNINYIQDFYKKTLPFEVFFNQNINKSLLVLHVNLSDCDLKLYNIYFSKLLIQIIPLLTSRINVKGLLYEVSLSNTLLPQSKYYKAKDQFCLVDVKDLDRKQVTCLVKVSQSQLKEYEIILKKSDTIHYFKFINNNREKIIQEYNNILEKYRN